MMEPAAHAHLTFEQVESHGDPCRPLEFPSPLVGRGVRVNALVVDSNTGSRKVWSGVIHREDLGADPASATRTMTLDPRNTNSSSRGGAQPIPPKAKSNPTTSTGSSSSRPDYSSQFVAYAPSRRLQDAIYGSVWACVVLQRHHGVAADDAARAAGVEPGSPQAPIVWETTNDFVAIKMIEWARVHHMRGRLLEDPVKEIAAMQLVGNSNPHVLGPIEVLQDGEFLFTVMPYCSGGDLFGVVVKFAEESGGEVGMPEPVARYWFRQILWGLHHLQSVGVCHRDLSLENVLVDRENCLIIDMGMCLRVPYNDPSRAGNITDVTRGNGLRRLMRPQGVCGKHNYMSPEIFSNTAPFDGFAIDLWAAGVILYIMLTGFPPYDQANRTDQRFDLIVKGNLVRQLRSWGIHLSDDAGDLLQSMLQLDPRDRLTLAEVMAHPWVVNGEAVPPPPEPLPYY
ncbi:serine/threonine protein kinase [Nitzschia inconspicua]|uniref:Serine/threonine protein kinase n=1 Tax=Nitzschia inconspicua TaxID=303405 RepID=A0A9K3PWN1_9STRA|nr:serine/threonine protein kinase [Nitzschia inconspicua]